MGPDKRERITVHSERIVIIALRHATRRWCERCGGQVETLTTEAAQQVFEVVPDGFECVSYRKPYLRQAADGLITCLKSLLHFLEATRTRGGS